MSNAPYVSGLNGASAAPAMLQTKLDVAADAGSLVQQVQRRRGGGRRFVRYGRSGRYYGGTCWIDGVYVCGSGYSYRRGYSSRGYYRGRGGRGRR